MGKSGGEARCGALCFALLVCMCWLPGAVSVTQGEQFLDEKEKQVEMIAEGVRTNDAQKCERLRTCTNATCSRNSCAPGKDDASKYECMAVTYNKYCNQPKGCTDKTFDYTRSVVRTSINTDFNSTLTTIGTCAQRELDVIFKNISKPADLLMIYFGSNDGAWRGFPGSDQDVDDPECKTIKYDPRLRPWYRASSTVPKVIVILIDAGQSMNNEVLQGQGSGTVFENAKKVVAEFLMALNSGDYVNIIMFDSTKATPLSPTMVQVQVNANSLPELDPLKKSLAAQTSEGSSGTSDVVQGISAALQNFGSNHPDAAKIILIFTDGNFASGNISIPVTNLTALNVKMFVYKIPPINDDKLFIGSSDPFATQLCSIGGSFEVISKISGLSNPLLALNSFFTFTAALHAKVTNNSADYSPIYAGYEEVAGNITTVSIPVFGAEGTFLGVAGMDIFINNLRSLTDSVQTAILTRSVGKGFKTSHFLLTKADCSLQTVVPSADPCNTTVANILDGGFCSQTDQTSKIGDLACCGTCKSGEDGHKLGSGAIAGIAIGAIAGIAALVVLLCCLIRRFHCCSGGKPQGGAEKRPFPGDNTGGS